MHDNDTAGIMSLVIDFATKAFKRLLSDKMDRLLWFDIIQLLSICDPVIDDLKSTNDPRHETLKIRTELEMPQGLKMINYFIALALDSLEQHKIAQPWLDKPDGILMIRVMTKICTYGCLAKTISTLHEIYFVWANTRPQKRE